VQLKGGLVRILLPLLLVANLLVFALGSNQAAKPPLTISISIDKPIVKAGEEVLIKVHLTNTSDQGLDNSANINDMTGVDPNYFYDVHDTGGKLVRKRVYEHPELATGHAIFRSVKPGESITDVQDLSRLYDMRQPGKYVIQVSRRISEGKRADVVKSNKITVTVTP
jgi:hypothetical protein